MDKRQHKLMVRNAHKKAWVERNYELWLELQREYNKKRRDKIKSTAYWFGNEVAVKRHGVKMCLQCSKNLAHAQGVCTTCRYRNSKGANLKSVGRPRGSQSLTDHNEKRATNE